MTDPSETLAEQAFAVHPGEDVVVTEGVALGEPVSFADELVMDDVYQLRADSPTGTLVLRGTEAPGCLVIAAASKRGEPGRIVHLDSCLTFMARDGSTLEALVLVEVEDGAVADIHLLPLAPLTEKHDYRLVGIDRGAATTRMAEIACGSFTRGTRIALASGELRPVEELRAGDRILTRDDGAQPVRWVGQQTLRAVGEFAPVVIAAGALHNEGDLVVAPDHRIFVWQREDRLGAGRSEVLVKARHLVNGTSVYQRTGGFVDYFQLLFDEHQIVYAEGIAAESLLVDPRTRVALPPESQRAHRFRAHMGYEVAEQLLSRGDAAALLRRASAS
ncbi:Hint domain-containing protein [Wenxinia marina]|uniref:Hint domain protein n=1 Tax=Wenxinia marina DSM 24838 TaxID=1123501 RepID=A0A0D0Q298_9RHOB|nr:Hint domain-containing protein [Wenxinia marina]KIQ68644.1 Hint domain protein [Wenxinia marina DSM 24838]GGL67572.1 hypothetical protein GCM10011392_22580 [Wenxinia marina]